MDDAVVVVVRVVAFCLTLFFLASFFASLSAFFFSLRVRVGICTATGTRDVAAILS